VEAARAGEPDWAEAVMQSHLHNARETLLGEPAEVTA
jgi:DNA-binding FadR family transcriptional regulator